MQRGSAEHEAPGTMLVGPIRARKVLTVYVVGEHLIRHVVEVQNGRARQTGSEGKRDVHPRPLVAARLRRLERQLQRQAILPQLRNWRDDQLAGSAVACPGDAGLQWSVADSGMRL